MKKNKINTECDTSLLKCVEKIANAAESSEISSKFLSDNKEDLKRLSDFLEISETQAVLFSVIFNLNFGSTTVDLEQMADYFKCSAGSVVGYLTELDNLVEKKLLRRQKKLH